MVAAIAKPMKEPIQIPTAKRNHSRRHSGQPATARVVDRRAATKPTAAHNAALDAMTASHFVLPVASGNPKTGSVGQDSTASTNPIRPRAVDWEPHRAIMLATPAAAIGTSAARDP